MSISDEMKAKMAKSNAFQEAKQQMAGRVAPGSDAVIKENAPHLKPKPDPNGRGRGM